MDDGLKRFSAKLALWTAVRIMLALAVLRMALRFLDNVFV